MKPKLTKHLIIIFALTYILALISTPQITAAPATPKVSVEPAINSFTTDVTKVGDTFTVSVVTSGWEPPGVFAYECKLRFDPTLLELTAVEYPADHFIAKGLPAGTPLFTGPVDPATIAEANTNGYIGLAASPLADPAAVGGRTGSGTLAKLTFKIKTAPPPTQSCKLEIIEPSFLNPAGDKVTVETEDGYYEFSLPKAPVYLKVTPETTGAAKTGEKVTVSIVMNNLRAVDKLIGVEFKLEFDPTLLMVTDVVEGDFLKSQAEKAKSTTGEEYGTAFDWKYDAPNNYIICFTLYYRVPWPPAVFPEGSGTLAKIAFSAIRMPTTQTTIKLRLFDVVMLDVDGNEISYNRLEDGKYLAPLLRGDINMDNTVNVFDVFEFGKAFGTTPDHPRWNPRADLDGDNKVSILDGVIIAKNFGKTIA
jgi:hypothetical protein